VASPVLTHCWGGCPDHTPNELINELLTCHLALPPTSHNHTELLVSTVQPNGASYAQALKNASRVKAM
jgi:hypothetical protein